VLLVGVVDDLVLEHLQAPDELLPGLAGQDHVVDVAALGSDVWNKHYRRMYAECLPFNAMPATITKGQILKAVAGLPENATVDDAIERLLFLSKIEQGLEQARNGEIISHEEVKRRIEAQIASWQK
jgi:hypothetical protein